MYSMPQCEGAGPAERNKQESRVWALKVCIHPTNVFFHLYSTALFSPQISICLFSTHIAKQWHHSLLSQSQGPRWGAPQLQGCRSEPLACTDIHPSVLVKSAWHYIANLNIISNYPLTEWSKHLHNHGSELTFYSTQQHNNMYTHTQASLIGPSETAQCVRASRQARSTSESEKTLFPQRLVH